MIDTEKTYEMIKKIDLMIVGGHKAGTTSLKNYLNEHPEILGHIQRDMKYFMNDDEFRKGYIEAFKKYMNVGDISKSKRVVAKDAGNYLLVDNLKRIKNHNFNCKIVLIVRDPVQRAYSHYKFEISKGYYHGLNFSDIKKYTENNKCKDEIFNHILTLGKYAFFLRNILSLFDKKNVKIIKFEDLKDNPLKVCQDIFTWLRVNPSFKPNIKMIHNESKKPKSFYYSKLLGKIRSNKSLIYLMKFAIPSKVYKNIVDWTHNINSNGESFESIDESTKNILINYYKPFNRDLEELAGIDLSNWN